MENQPTINHLNDSVNIQRTTIENILYCKQVIKDMQFELKVSNDFIFHFF